MICPMMSSKGSEVNCREKDCALWLELFAKDSNGETVKDENGNAKRNGKCSLAWSPILQIEIATAAVASTIKKEEIK